LAQSDAAAIISRMAPGDNVWFNAGSQRINGRVIKLNRKTVEVAAADGRIWRVAASLIYTFR
jgi:preprotein translocase subunit YajC